MQASLDKSTMRTLLRFCLCQEANNECCCRGQSQYRLKQAQKTIINKKRARTLMDHNDFMPFMQMVWQFVVTRFGFVMDKLERHNVRLVKAFTNRPHIAPPGLD